MLGGTNDHCLPTLQGVDSKCYSDGGVRYLSLDYDSTAWQRAVRGRGKRRYSPCWRGWTRWKRERLSAGLTAA